MFAGFVIGVESTDSALWDATDANFRQPLGSSVKKLRSQFFRPGKATCSVVFSLWFLPCRLDISWNWFGTHRMAREDGDEEVTELLLLVASNSDGQWWCISLFCVTSQSFVIRNSQSLLEGLKDDKDICSSEAAIPLRMKTSQWIKIFKLGSLQSLRVSTAVRMRSENRTEIIGYGSKKGDSTLNIPLVEGTKNQHHVVYLISCPLGVKDHSESFRVLVCCNMFQHVKTSKEKGFKDNQQCVSLNSKVNLFFFLLLVVYSCRTNVLVRFVFLSQQAKFNIALKCTSPI